MALGASARELVLLVAVYGGAPLLAGLGIGLGLSLAFGKVMGGLLYGIQPTDPRILSSAAILLAGVAAVAMIVPAGKASRVDPAVALRNE